MKEKQFDRLISFISKLEKSKIAYNLIHSRDNAIMVTVVVPGEHWEIEFLDDGTIEVEKFISSGDIFDESELDDLFTRFSD